MKKETKVYCKYCYYNFKDGYYIDLCNKNPEIENNYYNEIKKYYICHIKNENNNCKDYKISIFMRMKKSLDKVLT
jgi:hypothetical protein